MTGLRVHPYYEERSKADDVAVLTLGAALAFGPRIQPIALAPVGGGPAPGTALGLQRLRHAAGGRAAERAPVRRGARRDLRRPVPRRGGPELDRERPVRRARARARPCFADSGGPLTAGGAQVGVASYAPPSGCGHGPSGFADVTVPEVRAFIDGSPTPPAAPRQSTPTLLYALNTPVVGSPITCAPGTWANAAALGYTFLNEATGAALQAGPAPSYTPPAAARGATVSCIVTASSAGGTSTAWSGISAAVQADVVPPKAVLRSVRCRKRRCTVRLEAADPNSQGALKVRVTAERRVRARCGKRKRPCVKTRSRSLKVVHGDVTKYRATSKQLKRGRTRIRVRVVDAAGNRRKPDLTKRVRIR